MKSTKNDPRAGSEEPVNSKSRLRRLEAQLEDPKLSDAGRETLKRVIAAIKKAGTLDKVLSIEDKWGPQCTDDPENCPVPECPTSRYCGAA